jgi:hypothetical protein
MGIISPAQCSNGFLCFTEQSERSSAIELQHRASQGAPRGRSSELEQLEGLIRLADVKLKSSQIIKSDHGTQRVARFPSAIHATNGVLAG